MKNSSKHPKYMGMTGAWVVVGSTVLKTLTFWRSVLTSGLIVGGAVSKNKAFAMVESSYEILGLLGTLMGFFVLPLIFLLMNRDKSVLPMGNLKDPSPSLWDKTLAWYTIGVMSNVLAMGSIVMIRVAVQLEVLTQGTDVINTVVLGILAFFIAFSMQSVYNLVESLYNFGRGIALLNKIKDTQD